MASGGGGGGGGDQAPADTEPLELVLFQVAECYVYLVRFTALLLRLRLISPDDSVDYTPQEDGCLLQESCTQGRFSERVNRTQWNLLLIAADGRQRHAFIGLGFRERPEAYDFQAALHDHMKYLNKKKAAEEMVQHYEKTSSVDYSLKEGETLVLQLKNKESGIKTKSAFFEQGLNRVSVAEKANSKEAPVSLKLPPPPPSPVSPTDSGVAASPFKAEFPPEQQSAASTADAAPTKAVVAPEQPAEEESPFKAEFPPEQQSAASTADAAPTKAVVAPEQPAEEEKIDQETVDDDFGDFQAAG
ncbi:hypothetical protein PR202_gb05541 [Eleusine coracana subsp. coracana]|uniref:NECAP PHear domain-containing protein n=1 Tax=Eleusine coracana subsp. coracana TaxID=191504 RepID=A0AAV5E5K9_ELECO|nr:hypothetical protein PR202_gb05541 [Eleusine coracana subsp. coracana]